MTIHPNDVRVDLSTIASPAPAAGDELVAQAVASVAAPALPAHDLLTIPATGEVLDLHNEPTLRLVEQAELIDELAAGLAAARQMIAEEVAARLDRENVRSYDLEPGLRIETNPPTEDRYAVDRTREVLEAAAGENLISRDVIDRVITTPKPIVPEPRVDKRELNKLLRNPELAQRLAAIRDTATTRRILRIKREAAR